MQALAILGFVIVFLVGLGRFLDTQHLEKTTIDKIRLLLIKGYIFLYDIPTQLTSRSGKFIRWLDAIHEKQPFDIRTGQYIEEKRNWKPLFCRVSFAIIAPIVHMEFFFDEKKAQISRSVGWAWSIVGASVLAYMGPLLLMLGLGLYIVACGLFFLMCLAILEAIRRFLLVVLNKSTSPQTSPFSYFAGLVSVILAGWKCYVRLLRN
jgi:hypothetical protein